MQNNLWLPTKGLLYKYIDDSFEHFTFSCYILIQFFRQLTDPRSVLEAMLKPKITALPGHIQSVYVQNTIKLYANIIKRAEEEEDGAETIKQVGELLQEKLPIFIQSSDLEVQERVRYLWEILHFLYKYTQVR